MDIESNVEIINVTNCDDCNETDIVDEQNNALYSFCENNHTNWE